MTKSGRKPKPRRMLKELPSIPVKNPSPDKVAEATERRAEVSDTNAELRRTYLARAVGEGRVFSCHVLYQTAEVRGELFNAAERSLDLAAHLAESDADTRVWRAPELEIRLRAIPLGALGGPLSGGGTPLRRGENHEAAVAQRRAAVKEAIKSLADASQVVFVELEGKKAFEKRPTDDPKFAIRLGCADAGRVSQFITPERQAESDGEAGADDGDDDEKEGKLQHRADAAWADGMRQAGMSFVPRHTLDGAIPERLNQLTFWIVRRNTGEATRNKQFTPIAVLIRPEQDCVLGRTPGMPTWAPYPELLRGLTGLVRGPELKTAEQQKAETVRFIWQVLYNLRGEPTVVLAHAQNMRSRWE